MLGMLLHDTTYRLLLPCFAAEILLIANEEDVVG